MQVPRMCSGWVMHTWAAQWPTRVVFFHFCHKLCWPCIVCIFIMWNQQGKGKEMTYWLTGFTGGQYNLPTPPTAWVQLKHNFFISLFFFSFIEVWMRMRSSVTSHFASVRQMYNLTNQSETPKASARSQSGRAEIQQRVCVTSRKFYELNFSSQLWFQPL